jgi:hypothetical protein
MFWALLLIGGVILLLKFPTFRTKMLYTVGATAGILALAGGGYFLYDRQQTEASKHLVQVQQLQFTDLRLGPESYGSSYKLVGRVKNNSLYTVHAIRTKIQIQDCDEKAHCEVVGEGEQDIAPLLPPNQVREIDSSFYFGSGTRIRGQFQWTYAVQEIRARPPE